MFGFNSTRKFAKKRKPYSRMIVLTKSVFSLLNISQTDDIIEKI